MKAVVVVCLLGLATYFSLALARRNFGKSDRGAKVAGSTRQNAADIQSFLASPAQAEAPRTVRPSEEGHAWLLKQMERTGDSALQELARHLVQLQNEYDEISSKFDRTQEPLYSAASAGRQPDPLDEALAFEEGERYLRLLNTVGAQIFSESSHLMEKYYKFSMDQLNTES